MYRLLLFQPLDLFFFFFNDTATTEIYTLSLHDALPISRERADVFLARLVEVGLVQQSGDELPSDRKSTRLNSSHDQISYAVFCLKKKKEPFKPKSDTGLLPVQMLKNIPTVRALAGPYPS